MAFDGGFKKKATIKPKIDLTAPRWNACYTTVSTLVTTTTREEFKDTLVKFKSKVFVRSFTFQSEEIQKFDLTTLNLKLSIKS